jgi:Fe-S cluster biosynthesis and repair protein YggX
MVMYAKFGREMEGLDRVPWKGEIGQRLLDSISKEDWKLWEEQMEQFFFGEGAKLPGGYVPQKAKG